MTKLAKKYQYDLLTEAMGDSLVKISKHNSPMMVEAVMQTVRELARHLMMDNHGFDSKRFIESVEDWAELNKIIER